MLKKITYILIIMHFVTSCADTFRNVKQGITGEKRESSDEFLVQKKDPLILPPDYENLPTPDDRAAAAEDITTFEKNLGISIEDTSQTSSSVEESILKKIQSK